MSQPSVSVIIPAYKQADFVEACLDSVAAQTYAGPVEAVVIDDGSPDDVVRRARAHPLSPIVVEKPNGGVSSARNAGVAASSGEYVAFLDADDRWLPRKLEVQLAAMQRAGEPCLSFTRYRRVDADGAPRARAAEHPSPALSPSARRLLYQNFVGTSTVIAHRACLERCGHFIDDHDLLRAGQDYALWLRIALHFPLVYVPEVFTLYTVHASNRVGIDPLKHHMGGVNALRALWEWDAPAARRAAGVPLEGVIAWRSLKLLRDLVVRRAEYPEGTLARALPVMWQALRGSS